MHEWLKPSPFSSSSSSSSSSSGLGTGLTPHCQTPISILRRYKCMCLTMRLLQSHVPSPPAEVNCCTMLLFIASILSLVLHATMGDLASKYLYNVTLFDDDRATVYALQTWYLYSRLHKHIHVYQFETSLKTVVLVLVHVYY